MKYKKLGIDEGLSPLFPVGKLRAKIII